MTEQNIQLYSLATPNGQKVSIALEEMGIPYDAYLINIVAGDQFSDEYVKISPNSKIPAIIDPNSPDGEPLTIMESGAILIYLAEKSGMFLSENPRIRSETLQWLFFQVAHIGPMFGQFGHFYKYAKDQCDHPYPLERYSAESKRLLAVLDKHLQGKTFLVNQAYSIADMAIFPWVGCLDIFYEATDFLSLAEYENVQQWYQSCASRPAAQRGAKVCALPS